ncbi:MAG: hypothetical protein U0Z53_06150 [Blastocatellia bacterium]
MSQQGFQAAVARLVLDPAWRERVREQGQAALASDLTELEQRRIMAVAADRGMDATRLLHKAFRLTKLYNLLPLTCQVLGADRLAAEASAYWHSSLPVSHYFLEECLGFCQHLKRRMRSGLRVKYLAEVVAYECATLELRAAHLAGELTAVRAVDFRCDAVTLFEQLAAKRRLRGIPRCECRLIGQIEPDGSINWEVAG